MKTVKPFQLVLILISSAILAACGGSETEPGVAGDAGAAPGQIHNWKLVTSWPKNFPGLGTAPEIFARKVQEMSNGRMNIRVYGAGEIVPALEVFDAVSAGTAEIGHGAAYYWKGKVPEAQFFTALPFGMNGREMNAWIHY
ncbi:MAG: ABC transporter substrate-binding protein, partial [Pseudohongiellaceae bacterium]